MQIIRPLIQKWEKLCQGNKFLFFLYAKPYRKAVAREAELANITSTDKVLNIGCGALPFTAYYLQKITRDKVIAIDNDRSAVEQAAILLSDLELKNNIELKTMTGTEAVTNLDYNVVVAALQTANKEKILARISETKTNDNWKFVLREPRERVAGQYDSLSSDIPYADQAKQYFPTFSKSVMLTANSLSKAVISDV